MLIQCPECNKQISDRAISCPNCGFPISQTIILPPKEEKPVKRQNIKFGRLPNGFGSIKKLSGKRRNPYAAYESVKGYDLDGKPIKRKCIGYFPSYRSAYEFLVEHNRNPLHESDITFEEIYNLFVANKVGTVSESAMNGYKYSYRRLKPLHNMPFQKIKAQDLQNALDKIESGYSTVSMTKTFLSTLYTYAIQNDVVDKNYAKYLVIKKEYDVEKGEPFTETELKSLWKLRDDKDCQVLLILIYTGMRIGELKNFKYKDGFITGGIKTKAGKNRTIPVLEEIQPFVESFSGIKRESYTKNGMRRILDLAGCKYHTSQDCRHTFSWLADKYNVDEMVKHLVMGHSLGNDVEKKVYGHRTKEELKSEIEKIKIIK